MLFVVHHALRLVFNPALRPFHNSLVVLAVEVVVGGIGGPEAQ